MIFFSSKYIPANLAFTANDCSCKLRKIKGQHDSSDNNFYPASQYNVFRASTKLLVHMVDKTVSVKLLKFAV